MKKVKIALYLIGALIISSLAVVSCNEPGDDSNKKNGDAAELLVLEDGGLYILGNGTEYPGAEVNLSNLAAGKSILDIANYGSVTVNALLFSDTTGETPSVKTTASDNIAQFTLLKNTGNWDIDSNKCASTKYNMEVSGETVMAVTGSASGVPKVLLLQANWKDFKDAVKSIKVNSITFTPAEGNVVLDEIYDKGSFLTVSGNKIIFNNATYEDGAALFAFPSDWKAAEAQSLKGKTLKFNFNIPDHTCVPSGTPQNGEEIEHQIHIQAAHNDTAKNKYSSSGQRYITLGDYKDKVFKISANDLITSSQNPHDGMAAFVLDAIRIMNNGTTYNESKEGATVVHYRCKTYTLEFNSITLE